MCTVTPALRAAASARLVRPVPFASPAVLRRPGAPPASEPRSDRTAVRPPSVPQEYSEEFRDIAAAKSKKGLIADGNITLINQRTVSDDLPVRSPLPGCLICHHHYRYPRHFFPLHYPLHHRHYSFTITAGTTFSPFPSALLYLSVSPAELLSSLLSHFFSLSPYPSPSPSIHPSPSPSSSSPSPSSSLSLSLPLSLSLSLSFFTSRYRHPTAFCSRHCSQIMGSVFFIYITPHLFFTFLYFLLPTLSLSLSLSFYCSES